MLISGALLAGCTTPASEPAAGVDGPSPAVSVRFEVPEEIDGLPRSPNSDYADMSHLQVEYLKRYVSTPNDTIAEIYAGEGLSDTIQISAVAGPVADQAKVVDAFFSPRRINDLRPVEPGALGGVARCGTVPDTTTYLVTICAWADEGSAGMLSIQSVDMKDRRAEFAKLRERFQRAGN
jgi:hypothetical protein